MNTSNNFQSIIINWEGFLTRQAGATFASNPYTKDAFSRALWSKGWQDADRGLIKPETAQDCYWIVDDTLDNRPREGFQVYFGCAFTAIGLKQSEHLRLSAALQSIPASEPVLRVRLARRHAEHSVQVLRTAQRTGGCNVPNAPQPGIEQSYAA